MTWANIATAFMFLVSLILLGMWLAGIDAELRRIRNQPPREMRSSHEEQH